MNADLFNLKIRTLIDACKNGTPTPAPSAQILYNQAIIGGIVKSSNTGHEIGIEIPEI